MASRTRVLIMGAAGRDFHNFNVYFRDNEKYEVVCFTATQIPDIAGRRYPASLAGRLYPEGIPIREEKDLLKIIEAEKVEQVLFAYSDVHYDYLMHRASMALAAGADFRLLGTQPTMLASKKPVISVCAVRTGCGKSQTTRRVCQVLRQRGLNVVAIRHPMPYGDLEKQKVQRFATYEDLDRHECTIEEREEYEPHIDKGIIVYAGVDYEAILRQAETEADVIVWDGGNNDTPFYRAGLEIVVVDPHRPGHELRYFPGEVNLRRADVIVINKMDTAKEADIETVRQNIAAANPRAKVVNAASPFTVSEEATIKGKRVLVVEDGPTLTHGEMKYGIGVIAAKHHRAKEIIDPRPFATAKIKETYEKYPEIGTLLPAMGYGKKQIADLEKTINGSDAELVVIGTPIDLRRVIKINKPTVRVSYELKEIGSPTLDQIIGDFLKKAR